MATRGLLAATRRLGALAPAPAARAAGRTSPMTAAATRPLSTQSRLAADRDRRPWPLGARPLTVSAVTLLAATVAVAAAPSTAANAPAAAAAYHLRVGTGCRGPRLPAGPLGVPREERRLIARLGLVGPLGALGKRDWDEKTASYPCGQDAYGVATVGDTVYMGTPARAAARELVQPALMAGLRPMRAVGARGQWWPTAWAATASATTWTRPSSRGRW